MKNPIQELQENLSLLKIDRSIKHRGTLIENYESAIKILQESKVKG